MTEVRKIYYNATLDAPVAQLVEHLTLNQGVQGSSPCGCTFILKSDRKYKPITYFLSLNLLHIYYIPSSYLLQ